MRSLTNLLWPLALAGVGLLLFVPFGGNLFLLEGEEVKLASVSVEMLKTGKLLRPNLSGRPYLENPPLFFWIQSLCMRLFGVGEGAARLPGALAGALSIATVFVVGRRLHGAGFGLLWAACMVGALFPNLYFRTGLADPLYTLFFFLSVSLLAAAAGKQQRGGSPGYAALSGFMLGMAVLVRGPVGLIMMAVLLLGFFLANGARPFLAMSDLSVLVLSLLMTALLWFGYEFAAQGPEFLGAYLNYQLSYIVSTGGSVQISAWLTWALLLLGFFPVSYLALPMLLQSRERQPHQFHRWMVLLLVLSLVVSLFLPDRLALFGGTAWFPLSYLAALHFQYLDNRRDYPNRTYWLGLAVLGVFFTLLTLIMPGLMSRSATWLAPRLYNEFWNVALKTQVHWSRFEGAPALFLGISLWIGYRLAMRRQFAQAGLLVMAGTMVAAQLSIFTFIPRLAAYFHLPAVAYVQKLKQIEEPVGTLGYESYLPSFYGTPAKSRPHHYLLRADKRGLIKDSTNYHVQGAEGGYLFLERK